MDPCHSLATPFALGVNPNVKGCEQQPTWPGQARSNIEMRCGELFHTLKAPHGLSMHGQALPSCCHLEADMPS